MLFKDFLPAFLPKRMTMKHLIILAWFGLSACSSRPLQFYLLNAETGLSAATTEPALPQATVLGLGPIHLPAYLDRPQLVMAISAHEYRLSEQQRWAERLDENIARALTSSLSRQLGIEHIVRYPWAARQPIDYQISVDILELHQTVAGQSHLAAQWQLKKAGQATIGKRFECNEAAADDAEAIVAAQSRCLTRFSVEIAAAVRQLSGASQ